MALKLKGSTSGFVGLDAPSVAGNNTLILPDSAGSAHQILANDISLSIISWSSGRRDFTESVWKCSESNVSALHKSLSKDELLTLKNKKVMMFLFSVDFF